jgi:hypothetical protein
MTFLKRSALVGLALLVAATTSCEKGARLAETGATLEGTVTFKKQPVPYALIVITGGESAAGSAQGSIGEDGRYHVTNVPIGQVKIAVITEAVKMQVMMAGGQYGGPNAKGKAKGPPPKFVDVDPKYANPDTSGITTAVNKGPNEFNIVID